ncbi:MAG TPA: SprT-like domain-containing protein [Pyrinomonadaceae bacterium]|nr:SprT-like domain-containing protein [Pyrinomonadaceae bacterium]
MSSSLEKLFGEAFSHLGGERSVPPLDVRFYPYAGLHHTIRLRSGRAYVRLSDICKDAPVEVHRALAFVLVARLLSKRTPAIHERIYRAYSMQPEIQRLSDIARRHRGRKMVSSAQGNVYDLNRMFARVNRKYFQGELPTPTITWSKRRTRRILGHHDRVYETITISKSLDSAEVPEWFTEFILYHEMLHIKHPAKLLNGRRYYHTEAFRTDERRFSHYQEAQRWLERVARQQRIARPRAA